MIIDLSKRTGCTFYKLMIKSGYSPYNKDYIRKDHQGRFHIKYLGEMKWDLHYDIDVEWRHFSINLPERNGKERKRIIKILYTISQEIKRVFKEKKQPQTYADVLRKKQPQVKKIKGLPTPPNPNKPKKFKPAYADPSIVKKELEIIKARRNSLSPVFTFK